MALNWGAQFLRLSVFSPSIIAITGADWKAITKQEESESRQNIPGGKRLSGLFGPGRLTVSAVGGRLDVLFTPPEKNEEPSEFKLPVIASWDDALKFFVAATAPWITNATFPIVRIAFGASLLSQADDRKQAYETLQSLLKSLAIAPERMRDLLYRINWPIESKAVPGVMINRLTTWSTLRVFTKLIQIGGGHVGEPEPSPEVYAVQLEIDHNTDEARTQPFDQGYIGPIFNELVEFANENVAKGERL